MSFVVEPYSLFLCYEIIDIKRAESLLPDNFELVKTKIFDTDKPKYYCIFGCIRAHTSAFWGSRTEFYIIAKDKTTSLISWIIIDYATDTISYDRKNGLIEPNCEKSVMTTNYNGELIIDIKKKNGRNKLSLNLDVSAGSMTNLDQRLWLEGNLSIGYGRNLSDNKADIFALKFNPDEIKKALKIPTNSINIENNDWFNGLFDKIPSQVVCFPYAQHFLSDSPGSSTKIQNKEELISSVNSIKLNELKVFSTKSFKRMFLINMIISFLITVTLIILLILK